MLHMLKARGPIDSFFLHFQLLVQFVNVMKIFGIRDAGGTVDITDCHRLRCTAVFPFFGICCKLKYGYKQKIEQKYMGRIPLPLCLFIRIRLST